MQPSQPATAICTRCGSPFLARSRAGEDPGRSGCPICRNNPRPQTHARPTVSEDEILAWLMDTDADES